MPSELASKMIDAAMEKNAVEFKNNLDASMSERIASQLSDKKLEISNDMFKEEHEYSKDAQMGIVNRKKKEAALDQNEITKKGSSPAKG